MNPVNPVLLTKSELNWIIGKNSGISKLHEYKIRSKIRRKLRILTNLEFPLIQKCGLFSEHLTAFGKNLTTFSKMENSIKSLTIENCAENKVGRDESGISDGSDLEF